MEKHIIVHFIPIKDNDRVNQHVLYLIFRNICIQQSPPQEQDVTQVQCLIGLNSKLSNSYIGYHSKI